MITKWDKRYMDVAQLISTWTKDRSKGVGCVLVGEFGEIRATGFNGFPRGVDDDVDARHERPAKYKWTEHAERNAIYNAAMIGVRTFGCDAYVTWTPCSDCARALIQAGVERVVVLNPVDYSNPTFGEDFRITETMFCEAGIDLEYISDGEYQ